MKLLLLGDIHYGVRNDHSAFIENNKLFFDNVLFPYIDKNNIDFLIQLGDLVDRRKYANINTVNRLRKDFLDPLFNKDVNCIFLLGNHDTYHKNTNELNFHREFIIDKYDNISVIKHEATEFNFNGTKILIIPWMNSENREQILNKIGSTDAKTVIGHLEISGFEMYKGSIVSHGDDRSIFDRFDRVFSGHFHHRSNDGHIYYLGSHGEFTWSDYNDPKGFHVFDTETNHIEFIKNPYTIFKKVWYDDTVAQLVDFRQFNNSIVKVIVQQKTNLIKFDKFIESIEASGPIDLQVVEDHLNLGLEDDTDIVSEAEDTLVIFKNYIEKDDEVVNKPKLYKFIDSLYNEAQELVIEE